MAVSRLGFALSAAASFALFLAVVYVFAVFWGATPTVVVGKPGPVLLYAVSFVAAEAIRGLRLALLYRGWRGVLGAYPAALGARLVGVMVSALTPSALGGELVRGVFLAGGLRGSAWATGVGLADGLYDLFSNTLLALVLAVFYWGPYTPPVLLLGVGATTAWLTAAAGSGFAPRLVERCCRRLAGSIAEASAGLRESLRRPRVAAAAMTLSAIAWLVQAGGFYAIVEGYCGGGLGASAAIAVFLQAMLAGITPVPGGLVAVDAYMASVVCPTAVVAWRTVSWPLSVGLGFAVLGLAALSGRASRGAR